MGSVQDLDGDSDLTRRRIWQRTHLKLVDKPLAMDSEQTVSRETSPVNNVTEQHVYIKAGETKDNDSEGKDRNETTQPSRAGSGTSHRKSVKRQKKTSKQKKNLENRHRPVPVCMGEVKQTTIEPFPSADGLLFPLSYFEDSEEAKVAATKTGSSHQLENHPSQSGLARAQPKGTENMTIERASTGLLEYVRVKQNNQKQDPYPL